MDRFWNRRDVLVVLSGLALLMSLGCSGTEQGQPQTANPPEQAQANVELTGPAATVYAFLEGARRGDDQAVAALLTPLARQKQAERHFRVAPARSDTARFELGEVQMPNEQVAQVACRWIETDLETGKSEVSEATYVLRKEREGWRIGGVARRVSGGEGLLLLNYEDPDDMERQAQMLEAAMGAGQGSPAISQSPDGAPRR